MPRRLSNIEFAMFMTDNGAQVQTMTYPENRIFDWQGMKVLAFIGPNPIDMGDGNLYSDVYLSDVSDSSQLAAVSSGAYQQAPQSFLDALPESVKETIAEEAAQAGALLNSAGQSAASLIIAAARTIGQTAGAALSPVVSSLSPVLIGALVVLGLYLMPKR